MIRFIICLFLLIVISNATFAQKQVRIYGTISDAATGEVLPNASVYNAQTLQGAVSNTYGYYSVSIEDNGPATFFVSYIGYQSQQFSIHTQTDTCVNIVLSSGIELKEFEVTARRYQQMVKQTGLTQMPIKDIVFAPVVLGEPNLISALKTLPGVSSGKEGGSELFVRGGSYDQNLILLDEAPVYNLNHAFGLLSVFNTSTIKNVNLYKGGIPAEYGGRLSSVLDVSTREGNKKEYKGELSLSTVAGAFTFEGPIKKDKASFLFSARRSWIDQLLFQPMNSPEQKLGLYFYDINGKVNFKVKEKHNFYLSYYTGKDELNARFNDQGSKSFMHQGWGNQLASLRYNTVFKNGTFAQLTTYYTQFNEYDFSQFDDKTSAMEQGGASLLKEFGIKGFLNAPITKSLHVKTGFETLWRSLEPPYRKSEVNGTVTRINSQSTEEQINYAIYASAIYSYNKWRAELGLRGSIFADTKNTYTYLEPRLNASYQLNTNWKLKMGAMRNAQPLFAMQKNNNGFPGYTYMPLTNRLKPQESYQASLGASFSKNAWMFDVETYYKSIKNQASNYRFPYDIYSANDWYTLIDQGDGRAYGAEFLITYNQSGWDIRTSYTLAKAESKYPELNEGDWFPFDYDIRHDVSVVASKTVYKKEGKHRWFTSNFTLHSGAPVSMPTHTVPSNILIAPNDEYYFDFSKIDMYTKPNNMRMPVYHRLDFGYHAKKEKKHGSRTWSLGLINVYNRQNPYIYYRDDKGSFKQLTMFPLMPFVSFKRNF